MHGTDSVGVSSAFTPVYPGQLVERRYRSEIDGLLRELNALLPRYRMCVDGTRYASERNKLAVLTTCYNNTSLDELGLETLLQSLVNQRLALTAVLYKPHATTSLRRSK